MKFLKNLFGRFIGGRDKEKLYFILINTLVNVLFLGRSYILMQILNYRQLGQVAIFQTVILIISSLHFGILNGGYRLYCTEIASEKRIINNLFYTFSFFLTIFTIVPIYFLTINNGYTVLGYFSMVTGVLTMIKSWINNQLIAMEKLKLLNNTNLATTFLSILLLAFYKINPLLFSFLSIFSQVFSFVVILLIYMPEFRPTKLEFDLKVFMKIMESGFLVFITGLLLLVNAQVERFSIIKFIGVEGLGHYYLAILFVSLFALIPGSLDSIYLPQVLKMHKENAFPLIRASLNSLFKSLFAYSILSFLLLFLLAQPIINFLLPKYQNDLVYVYLIFPGLAIYTLSNPFALIFNVLIRYKYYLISYLGGTLIILFCTLAYYEIYGYLNIIVISVIKSISYSFIGLTILFGYYKLTKNHLALRFRIGLKNI